MRSLIQPGTIERRVFLSDDIESRAGEGGAVNFRGHAAVFNQWANIAGMFRERISPGAFAKTIGEADIRFLMNHDPQYVLARSKAGVGTLRLSEDKRGLLTEASMAPTTYAADLAVLLDRGDVSQMSFAFRATREEWDDTKKMPERTVVEAQVADVSVVTYPAYEGTDASLRSAQLTTLLDMLGLDTVEPEQRAALLMQARSGDVAAEYVPILRAAQERFSSLVIAPVEAPPDDDPATPPTGTLRGEGTDIDIMRRRHALNASRFGITA